MTGAGEKTRGRVLVAARRYLGTPYRHQGSRAGIGCDCLGLLRGVWRDLYGEEPEDPGPYATDWSVRAGEDRLTAAAGRHLIRLDTGCGGRPGDVALFAWRAGAPSTHCGILDEPEPEPERGGAVRLIHAYEGASVVSSPMPLAWRRRITGLFSFPE